MHLRFCLLLALAGGLALCQGCMTRQLWRDVRAAPMQLQSVSVIEDRLGPGGKPARYLMLHYINQTPAILVSKTYDLAFPLEGPGLAPYTRPDDPTTLRATSVADLDRLRHSLMRTPEPWRQGWRLREERNTVLDRYDRPESLDKLPLLSLPASQGAIFTDERLAVIRLDAGAGGAPGRTLVVPYRLPLSPEQRAGRYAVAAIETPFFLIGDLVRGIASTVGLTGERVARAAKPGPS